VKTLYRYECRNCKTWAVTADDMGRAVRCNGCKGYKVFRFSTEAEGDQDERIWQLAKERGTVHLPLPDPFHVCAECKTTTDQVQYYARRWLCFPCYRAAQPAPEPKPYPSEDELTAMWKEDRDRKRQEERDAQERLEKA
jgi:hypothetical protein